MKNTYAFLPVVVILFTLGSCTPKMTFLTSAKVPAATGSVKVKKDKNNNYIVNLEVVNLAAPDRLDPPRQVYVVWADLGQNTIKKLGLLKPSSRKDLKASLSAPSASEPVRVFITAERDTEIQYPTGDEILATARR